MSAMSSLRVTATTNPTAPCLIQMFYNRQQWTTFTVTFSITTDTLPICIFHDHHGKGLYSDWLGNELAYTNSPGTDTTTNHSVAQPKHMRWILHLNLVIDRFKCYSACVL